ncbi:TPA: hypothetical protein ACGJR1_006570, partial [Pseudomonas aeruginosa]
MLQIPAAVGDEHPQRQEDAFELIVPFAELGRLSIAVFHWTAGTAHALSFTLRCVAPIEKVWPMIKSLSRQCGVLAATTDIALKKAHHSILPSGQML